MGIHRLPGRHGLQRDFSSDGRRPGPGIRIGHQRKWRNVTRPMTRLAVLLEDPNDLIVESDGARGISAPARQKKKYGENGRSENHAIHFTLEASSRTLQCDTPPAH